MWDELTYRIRNECIREKVEVAAIIKNKMVEFHLRWFVHMWRKREWILSCENSTGPSHM